MSFTLFAVEKKSPRGVEARSADAERRRELVGDGTTSEPRTDTQLEEEARLIDRAREAVTAGNSGLALRELDAHGARFARPVFRPEALYLRMQALRLNGNEEAARQIARRLLTAYPNGPQAAAARAFLKTSEP